jgi:hypothetical protein
MTQEDLLLPTGFGSPSGSNRNYETWKLKQKDDEIVIRILPLMKSLLKRDDFGLFWKLHFGWNGRNPKDVTKVQYHPFLCVEEKSYGMITQECPACNYRNSYLKKLETAKIDMENQIKAKQELGRSKNIPEDQIAKAVSKLREECLAKIKPLSEWVNNHGADGKFRIPCINKQGQFGIFLAPYGVVKQLKEEIRNLKTRNYPGTDIPMQAAGRKGVWFKITRSGNASPTSDTAKPCRIVREDGAEVLDFHVISNEQLQQAQDRLPDLEEMRELARIRLDQMEALIQLDKDGGGSSDPLEVDLILETAKNNKPLDPPMEWAEDPAPPPAPQIAEPAPAAKVETKPEPPKAEPTKVEPPKIEDKPKDTFDDLWS